MSGTTHKGLADFQTTPGQGAPDAPPVVQPQYPAPQANPWALPAKAAITCTGRRVVLTPYDFETERMILRTQDEEASVEATLAIYGQIISKHVFAGTLDNYRPIENYSSAVTLIEENDMLMLSRITSYGPEVPFLYTCPKCNKIAPEAVMIDLREFKRKLFECSNEACPCHDINERASQLWDEPGWDQMKWMREEWSKVPENHLQTHPPENTYRPSQWPGAEIRYRHTPISQRTESLMPHLKKTSDRLQKEIERQVTRVTWPNCPTGPIDAVRPGDLSLIITQWSASLRTAVLNHIAESAGGFDQTMDARCSNLKCQSMSRIQLPFGAKFFYPLK